MTVYQRLQAFYKTDRFRFKERDRKKIGLRSSALWKELYGNDAIPPLIESAEDSGTYKVFDYPEEFGNIIDQLIRNVHQEILDAARERRRIKEIADHSISAQAPPFSPPLIPLPKIRKRIPVKQIPVWKLK